MNRKLLKKCYCEDYIFSHWKGAPVVQFCKYGKEVWVILDSLKGPENNLCFFSEMILEVFDQFMGYVPYVKKGEHDDSTTVFERRTP